MQHTIKQKVTKAKAVGVALRHLKKNVDDDLYHLIESTLELTKELSREQNTDPEKEHFNIEIPLSEYDIEVFKDIVYNDSCIDWSFKCDTGERITVFFTNETKEEDTQ